MTDHIDVSTKDVLFILCDIIDARGTHNILLSTCDISVRK